MGWEKKGETERVLVILPNRKKGGTFLRGKKKGKKGRINNLLFCERDRHQKKKDCQGCTGLSGMSAAESGGELPTGRGGGGEKDPVVALALSRFVAKKNWKPCLVQSWSSRSDGGKKKRGKNASRSPNHRKRGRSRWTLFYQRLPKKGRGGGSHADFALFRRPYRAAEGGEKKEILLERGVRSYFL